MKRFLLLIAVLLCAASPALAVPPPEEVVAVTSLHPEHAITDYVAAGEDAFFLLESSKGVRSLCILRCENGVWAEALHSEAVICPSGRSDSYTGYRYDRISLAWDSTTLSICYEYRSGRKWHYDFSRTEADEWRFVRLSSAEPSSPSMVDVLTYSDGCVHQTFTKRLWDGTEEVSVYSPCPMPWLAGCETLAGFDAAAFPMDLYGLSDEELSRVAAELLPGYAFVDGKFSDGAAFLMDKPTGERVFMGGEYRDGAWAWVESGPLPEDTHCDSYHGSGSAMCIYFPKPNPSPDWVFDEEGYIPYSNYALYRQADGRWLIESILDEEDDWFHFESYGLYHNSGGTCFGEFLGERDVARVDWQTVPHTWDEVLALMSRDWGVVGYDRVPLRSGPGENTQETALCRYAAPVKVLDEQGDWAQVAILGGELTGWLPADTLLLGAEQMVSYPDYDDMWGFDTWTVSASCYAAMLECSGGTVLLDAPEGKVVWEDVSNNTVQLVCEMPEGWSLVCWPDTLDGGYIRAELTTLKDEVSHAPNLARERFPDCTLVYGECRDALALLLLDRPDGARVLTCGAYTDGAWRWTESTPLPPETLLAVTEDGDAVLCLRRDAEELCVRIRREEDAWRIRELQSDAGFNWMYTGGMLMAEDGTEAEGQPGFATDIRCTDWNALPWHMEDAVGMLVSSSDD